MSEVLPEPGGEPVEPETADVAEAPEWSGVSQDDWTQTQQLLEQQQQALGQIVQALTPQEQQQEFDPFDRDQLRSLIREEVQPLAQYNEAQRIEAGNAYAETTIEKLAQEDGGFLFDGSAEKARELANTHFNALAQQIPQQPNQRALDAALAQVADRALALAVKDVREWETAVGKAYYEREVNQIRGITNAPREPGANQTGATQQLTVTPGGPWGVLQKYTGQRH